MPRCERRALYLAYPAKVDALRPMLCRTTLAGRRSPCFATGGSRTCVAHPGGEVVVLPNDCGFGLA